MILPVDFVTALSLQGAMDLSERMPTHQALGWLLFLASQTSRSTHQLFQEINRMARNDAALTQAVQDLTTAFQANADAIAAEVAAIKAKGTDGADPAIATAVTNIEAIVAQMQQGTAAAQAAIAPSSASSSSSASGAEPEAIPSAAD